MGPWGSPRSASVLIYFKDTGSHDILVASTNWLCNFVVSSVEALLLKLLYPAITPTVMSRQALTSTVESWLLESLWSPTALGVILQRTLQDCLQEIMSTISTRCILGNQT